MTHLKVFFREWLFAFERKLDVKLNQHSQLRLGNYATFNLKLFYFRVSTLKCVMLHHLQMLLVQETFRCVVGLTISKTLNFVQKPKSIRVMVTAFYSR